MAQRFLYRPELLFDPATPTPGHLPVGSTPLPFPRIGLPQAQAGGPMPPYRCSPLIQLQDHSTSTTAMTAPAGEVEDLFLTNQHRLQTIRKCNDLNERLFRYGDFTHNAPGIIPNAAQLPYVQACIGPWHQGLKGLSTEQGVVCGLPNGVAQYKVIVQAFAIYMAQSIAPVAVENEAGIRFEHDRQILPLVLCYAHVSILTLS